MVSLYGLEGLGFRGQGLGLGFRGLLACDLRTYNPIAAVLGILGSLDLAGELGPFTSNYTDYGFIGNPANP